MALLEVKMVTGWVPEVERLDEALKRKVSNGFFRLFSLDHFLVADTQLYKRLCQSVRRSVGWPITLELKSGKTRISAPAHPSATDGRVSGLVVMKTSISSLMKYFAANEF